MSEYKPDVRRGEEERREEEKRSKKVWGRWKERAKKLRNEEEGEDVID